MLVSALCRSAAILRIREVREGITLQPEQGDLAQAAFDYPREIGCQLVSAWEFEVVPSELKFN